MIKWACVERRLAGLEITTCDEKTRTDNVYKNCNTGCGYITSLFIIRGNQVVEVIAEWACFHFRDEILKFPWKYSQSLLCVGVVRNVRLPSKPTFRIDCL